MEAFNSLSPPLCARFGGGGGPRQRPRMSRKWSKGGREGINWGCPSPKEEGEDAGCVLACERSRRRFCQPKPAAPQSSSSMATLDESQAFLTCIKRTKYAGKGQARPPLPTLLARGMMQHRDENLGINESEPRQKVRSEGARRPKGRGRDRSWPRKSFYCQAGKLCSLELFFDRGPF